MITQDKKAELLHDLLDRCNDSSKGYSQAADSADSSSMKLYLHNIALERKDFGSTISQLVKQNGGEPSKGGTLKGAVHRNWLNVKAALSSNTEENILEECLRGEQRLVEDYVETIQNGDFNLDTKNVLARQLANVQERVSRMESLKEKV